MTTREIAVSAETTVYNKRAIDLYVGAPRSAMLGEAAVAESFSTFFNPTWTFNESRLVDQDLRRPTAGIWLTPLVSEEPPRRAPNWRPAQEVMTKARGPVQETNADRVALLARKYVSREKFSEEDGARLAILTERIRQMLPAVTIAEFEAIEEALKTVNRVSASNDAIRQSLDTLRKR